MTEQQAQEKDDAIYELIEALQQTMLDKQADPDVCAAATAYMMGKACAFMTTHLNDATYMLRTMQYAQHVYSVFVTTQAQQQQQ